MFYVGSSHVRGIRRVGEINGEVRCMESVCGGQSIWTADPSGVISIRRGTSGAALDVIERKKSGSVLCLLAQHLYVWAGLSDGSIRIFDSEHGDLVAETKAHSQAVTCLVGHRGRIFSGGGDALVFAWDRRLKTTKGDGATMVPLDRYQINQRIFCLAVDGQCLFAGDERGTIHCWDIDTSLPRAAPFPIVSAHAKSVTDLEVHEVYLFSASLDGSIKSWNVQTGLLVAVVGHHKGPVTSLMQDAEQHHIWSGGHDGYLAVWDALSLSLVARLPNSEQPISSLQLTGDVPGTQIWTVGINGQVKLWSCEAEAALGAVARAGYSALGRAESKAQAAVASMHATLSQTATELAEIEAQVKDAIVIRRTAQRQLALLLGQESIRRQTRWHLAKLESWLLGRQVLVLRSNTANIAGSSGTAVPVLRRYFHQWLHSLVSGHHSRRFEAAANALERTTASAKASAILRELSAYAAWARRRRQRMTAVAVLLERVSLLRSASCAYHQWMRCAALRRLRRRQEFVASAASRSIERATLGRFYTQLVRFAHHEDMQERRWVLCRSLENINDSVVLRRYYNALVEYRGKRRRRSHLPALAVSAEAESARTLLGQRFHAWMRWQKQRSVSGARDSILEAHSRLAWTANQLGHSIRIGESDQELAEALVETVDATVREGLRWTAILLDFRAEETRTRMINEGDSAVFLSGTVMDKVQAIMNTLRARYVSLSADFDLIADIRKDIQGKSPSEVFLGFYRALEARGINDLVKNLTIGLPWPLTSDIIRSGGATHLAHNLLMAKSMAICYEFMEPKDIHMTFSMDIAQNCCWLLELAEAAVLVVGLSEPGDHQSRGTKRTTTRKRTGSGSSRVSRASAMSKRPAGTKSTATGYSPSHAGTTVSKAVRSPASTRRPARTGSPHSQGSRNSGHSVMSMRTTSKRSAKPSSSPKSQLKVR
eukprot:NODE_64_length_3581_cov_24.785674_g57_i0.p1 GENE.NODE_64_length_3581_cov_24.785674_g57_i0~~NODE_64_length_3581_cov_24.785674_g57_i0.p1  ORF type:complete len:942 (-),score=148.93 NODE_64_length_3581_cov_24.785674_g57_i0:131-2956(-)